MKNDFYIENWNRLKIDLKKEFSNLVFYNNFFINSVFFKIVDKNCYIIVQNDFVKETLNKDYLDLIESKYSDYINMTIKIFFILDEEKTNVINLKNIEEKYQNIKDEMLDLNEDLVLENYIVGDFNKSVFQAAKLVIENNTSFSNSLFIYGSTGLGKTHILNLIGFEYHKNFPNKKIKLINTEDFLRKAYDAISIGGMKIEEFKNSFNDIDLLLVDDIQFLSNKDKLNEIFFNIFNNLIKNKKIIVMTSDKLPNNLKIDERMISRFNSGLSLKLSKPDIQTIKDIIIMKINKSNRKNEFTSNAVNFIANRYNTDIRTLEGVINKILFYAMTNMEPDEIINEDKIKTILEIDNPNSVVNSNSLLDPNVVIENICLAYGVSSSSVTSKKRQQQITFVRKVCMYVLREKLDLSFSEIGSFFSKRNHTTVMDSYNSIKEQIQTDSNLKEFIDNLISKL